MSKQAELFDNYIAALEASKAYEVENSIESLEIASQLQRAVRNAEQAIKAYHTPKVGA
jgi:hypothetical protein